MGQAPDSEATDLEKPGKPGGWPGDQPAMGRCEENAVIRHQLRERDPAVRRSLQELEH